MINNLHLLLEMSTKFLQSDFVIQWILRVAHSSQHALKLKNESL